MTRIEPSIELWGNAFYPSEAIHAYKVAFSQFQDPGSIGQIGKYKGLPLPYGSATISPGLALDTEENKIAWVCREFQKIQNHQAQLMIETARVHLHVLHDEQCNFDLAPESLRLLAELGIPLTVSTEQG